MESLNPPPSVESGPPDEPPPRVWVVSELYYPEHTSTGYFLTGIAEALAECAPVGVICAQPTYARRGERALPRERRAGVRIERSATTTFDKNSLPLRAVNALTIAIALAWRTARRVRAGDVVFVVTNPPLLPYCVAVAARARGARMVLIVHDVYPDALVVAGLLSTNSRFRRAGGRLAAWLYSRAERIVVLGRDMGRLVEQRLPASASRPIVIPNWGDIDQIRPLPRADNALLRELGIDSKFVVQLMGNIGRTHAIEGVLDAAELLADNSDVHFLIVSAGARVGWLRGQIAERKLGNVSWLPPCPPDALNVYLNACDVAAVPLRAGMTGVSMPSRLYNIFASGKPTLAIAEPETELAMTVTENDVGWVVPPNDPTAIADAVRAAAAQPAAVAMMGRRARELALSSFSRERAGAAYRALCGQLLVDARDR